MIYFQNNTNAHEKATHLNIYVTFYSFYMLKLETFQVLTVLGLGSSILHINDLDSEENRDGQEKSAALICKHSRADIRSFLMMDGDPGTDALIFDGSNYKNIDCNYFDLINSLPLWYVLRPLSTSSNISQVNKRIN